MEFRVETVNIENKEYLIKVKVIDGLVMRLQDKIDWEYKDAVLSNYSHEQLTPLNTILNNALLMIDQLSKIKQNINQ